MKQLPESVKQAEIEKYSFRAKRVSDMRDWWKKIGMDLGPFCDYFNPDLREDVCPCPLYSENNPISCCGKEHGAIVKAELNNDVKAFNTALQAYQNRIRALPTKKKRVKNHE